MKNVVETENKGLPLLFFSLWISCIRMTVRQYEVGIDRQLCEGSRWGYMPLNVQSYWSNRSRERAVDSIYRFDIAICAIISILTSILFPAAYCTALILCWQTNFIRYFFFLWFAKFDDKHRCGNVQFQVAGISWFAGLQINKMHAL